MSSSVEFRRPTWPGLRPRLPVPVPASDEEAETLRRLSGLSGAIYWLDFGDGPVGMFLFRRPEGDVFVKHVPSDRQLITARADALATWLTGKGVVAVAPLPGFPKLLEDGSGIAALPYVHGTRLEPKVDDLARLGNRLAQLHAALATHPERALWLGATRARMARLRAIRNALADGALQAGPHPERLRRLASEQSLDFDPPNPTPTPLHGDLNPGNVLLAEGEPLFLDFEDVFHSVLPIAFELCLVVERFVLVPASGSSQALEAGRAFIQAYAAAQARPITPFDPVVTLRSLALRSLCVLAEAEAQGARSPTGEWQKFLNLEALAAEHTLLLREIVESQSS